MSGAPIMIGTKPVAEAADQRRHDQEEDHDQAVRRGKHVEHVLAGINRLTAGLEAVDHLGQTVENLNARFMQFHAHGYREHPANDPRDNREDQVHGADILVVGRIEVALQSGRMVVRVMCGCSCHLSVLKPGIELRVPPRPTGRTPASVSFPG